MQRAKRLLYVLMWIALWASGLVGLASVAFLTVIIVEYVNNCDPPQGEWVVECMVNEDAGAFLIANGLPWLIPLAGALLVRALRRGMGGRAS